MPAGGGQPTEVQHMRYRSLYLLSSFALGVKPTDMQKVEDEA